MPITVMCDDETFALLQQIAQEQHATPEDVAQQALAQFAREHALRSGAQAYSFIGIGHSGKRNLSRQVDIILEQGANRREGWSLD